MFVLVLEAESRGHLIAEVGPTNGAHAAATVTRLMKATRRGITHCLFWKGSYYQDKRGGC